MRFQDLQNGILIPVEMDIASSKCRKRLVSKFIGEVARSELDCNELHLSAAAATMRLP